MKKITATRKFIPQLFSVLLLTTAHVLSWTDVAVAQLRLGTGIQPGLEGYLLESQLQNVPLSRLRGISGCSVGFGAGCNKTASLLQQIVQQQTGKSYQDVLIESAGGLNNYLRFQKFYPNATAVSSAPFSSFWRNRDSSILDRYENSNIGRLNSNSVNGLGDVVNNFRYQPINRSSNNLNLRDGLVGIKTAYGLTLVEEALKIPDIEQKIATFGLNSQETAFHLQQFRQAATALNSDDSSTVSSSIFNLVSNPYTDSPAELNRPDLDISEGIEHLVGVTQSSEQIITEILEGEVSTIDIPTSSEVLDQATNSRPLYVAAGIGGLALLILLLSSSGGNPDAIPLPPIDQAVTIEDFFTPPTPGTNPIFELPSPVLTIPESNNVTSLIALAVLILLCYRKRITT